MKTLTAIILLLTSLFVSSQEKKTVQIYETTNGIQNLLPTKTIVETPQSTIIYNNTNGVRDLFPSTETIDNKVYNVNNGIRELTPRAIIKKDDEDN
jgi:hypothetical protein